MAQRSTILRRKGLFTSKESGKAVVFQGFLRNAVQKYSEGNLSFYHNVIGQISDSAAKSSQMLEWYKEGREISHVLDKKHYQLVDALLSVRWMEREEEVLNSFKLFAISLVTTNTVYLRAVIKTLCKCLTPVETQAAREFDISTTDEKVYETVHSIFKVILQVIPSSKGLFMSLLESSFPYIKKPVTILRSYVTNLLLITSYQEGLRPDILAVVIQKLSDIDMLVPPEIINDEGDEESEDEIEKIDEEKIDAEENGMKCELENNLDILMDITFQYIRQCCLNEQGAFDPKKSQKVFTEVLHIFETSVLPLHAIVHVQFIIFYICSFNKSFPKQFLEFLWKKTTNKSAASYIRQASTCYIASFCARSNFVPLPTVLKYLKQMSDWSKSYLNDANNSNSMECNVAKHRIFYNICQAMFYIAVFRQKEILSFPPGRNFLRSLDFQQLIVSELNPLKVCLPLIVQMFSSSMRKHQLVYCETIIQRNNRQLLLPIVGMNSCEIASQNPLNCFFPFDPYRLQRSLKYIEPLYQEWIDVDDTLQRMVDDNTGEDDDIMKVEPTEISMTELINEETENILEDYMVLEDSMLGLM